MRRSRTAHRAVIQLWPRPAAALCAFLAALVMPAVASAAGSSFALQVTGSRAPYFVLAARPGATLKGDVSVINVSTTSGGVTLYTTDATTGQTSGAVYRSPQEPRRDVGAWIELAQHHLTLTPGQSEAVPFRVIIPSGARDGQHLGGIVAEPDQPRAHITGRRGKATFHVLVREEAVIAVEVNLPGPRTRQLAVTGIRAGAAPGYQTLLIGLASTGNSLTKGDGAITVTDDHGRQRLNQSFPLDTFVPDTQIQYPLQVAGPALLAGNYRAAITINYAGRHDSRTLPFTITGKNLTEAFGSRHTQLPTAANGQSMIPFIIAGLALLLVGFAFGARARNRRPVRR